MILHDRTRERCTELIVMELGRLAAYFRKVRLGIPEKFVGVKFVVA